jgi:hypothetical protein
MEGFNIEVKLKAGKLRIKEILSEINEIHKILWKYTKNFENRRNTKKINVVMKISEILWTHFPNSEK